jgi:hypothetical protein
MLPHIIAREDLDADRLEHVQPGYQPSMIMLMATHPARCHLSLQVRFVHGLCHPSVRRGGRLAMTAPGQQHTSASAAAMSASCG